MKCDEVEVKFRIKKYIYKCYRKCTKSRAKRLRPALVYLLYVYVMTDYFTSRQEIQSITLIFDAFYPDNRARYLNSDISN